MSDLRVYGFSIEVQNQDGTTKVKQFRRAVADVDSTVEMLNQSLGDNVRVTAEVTQTDKEAVAQARLLVQQQERQRRKTEEVVRQYTTLNQTIKQYGNDAETVNAITRLGSSATDAQKQQVAELVAEYQRLRNAGDVAGTGFRNLRGIAQNLGWQLQDVAVQAQMGTNWLVILGQQGSQMAASFGATGALVGAGIAIIAAAMPSLITYFTDANDSAKELEETQKRLNDVFSTGRYSVNGFNSELVKLYDTNRQLAEFEITIAALDAQKAIKSASTQIKEMTADLGDLGQGFRWFSSRQEEYDSDLASLAKQFGINTDQVQQLGKAYKFLRDTGKPDRVVELFQEIVKTTPGITDEFKELAAGVVRAGVDAQLAQKQLEMLNKVLDGSLKPTDDLINYNETLAERYERLRRQLTMTDRQIEIDNFLRLEAVNMTQQQAEVTRRALVSYLDERDAIEARNAAIERSQALDEARIKQRESLLTPIAQDLTITSSNPVTAEIEKNKQTMDTLRAQLSQTKQYEYSERARINDLIEKEEQRHTDALFEAQLTLASNQVSVIGSTAEFMTNLTDELFTGGEKVREAMEEMSGAQKAMFFITRAIAAAQAVVNGISLGGKLAEIFPLAAPAMVTFGTALGAAQAGAITGTTFAGAFDNGGYIPSGMTGIVSEYGDELVNGQLVKGPARVTSREDTAKMMGGMNVNVINNAPGVEHTVNQIDENTVEIIAKKVLAENIDSAAAGMLSKKGSKTNRALTGKYDVRNKY